LQQLVPAVSAVSSTADGIVPVSTTPVFTLQGPKTESRIETENQIKKKIWRRPRILDIILIWGLTYLVIWFWQYVIKKF